MRKSTNLMGGLLASLLLLSAAVITMGTTADARPGEAAGRVLLAPQTTVGSAWAGTTAQAKPEAGGRVIQPAQQIANDAQAWPGTAEKANPEAGGRVIYQASETASGADLTQTSAL